MLPCWAGGGNWTPDPFLTKEVLYPWATLASKVSGRRYSKPRPLAWKANALPTELLPLNIIQEVRNLVSNTEGYGRLCFKWGEQDSNLRRHSPADLQSAPVGRFGISPLKQSLSLKTYI